MRRDAGSELLHYRTWGEVRSRALLLVHPLGADHRFWNDAAELLQRRHFCIAVDLRASGRSPGSDHPVSLSEHVRDLDRLCNTLTVDSITVIGCAVGAMIAAAFAARGSLRSNAAVLSNPTDSFSPAARDMMSDRIEFARSLGMQTLAPQIVDRAFSGMPNDARKERFLAMVRSQSAEGYSCFANGVRDSDIADDLRTIACPVLVLTSSNDVLLPPACGARVAALLQNAKVEAVDDGSHFIPYQAPSAFVGCVDAFLSRQAS